MTALVTGANGELGHALIARLVEEGSRDVIAIDLREPDASIASKCAQVIVGDVTQRTTFEQVNPSARVDSVFHLAALLSTASEKNPERAQSVNVDGLIQALTFAMAHSARVDRRVKVLFPSSIAAYGVASLEAKSALGAANETQASEPTTMYGLNKRYGEQLGCYFSERYRQLSTEANPPGVDFRSIRYPGIISAFTLPTGGTSDYLPEYLHAAAQGKPYACFVRGDTRVPFMAMPDAVRALLMLEKAAPETLTQRVYNVTACNPTPVEFSKLLQKALPPAALSFDVSAARQRIVDSWPEQLDDQAARKDWGWAPTMGLDEMVNEYLLPNVVARYAR
ncbi:MAG: NAD-dependent epimerase/dehydratase family protein [Deltaproteobacteria bacterium]|nr:NAD-dependent epimerase/dehydratase family protein [Deltaproteobacteria bacterium]